MDIEQAEHKVYGNVVEGDLVITNVPCLVRITSVKQSPVADGMLRFTAEVVEAPPKDIFDCGKLVDTDTYKPTA